MVVLSLKIVLVINRFEKLLKRFQKQLDQLKTGFSDLTLLFYNR